MYYNMYNNMTTFLINAAIFSLYVINVSGFNVTDNQWSLFQRFVDKHQKQYSSYTEYKHRLDIFSDNLNFIHTENSKNNKYNLGITKFADLTSIEFSKHLSNFDTIGSTCDKFTSQETTVNEIDWRQKNAVTNVKDQGQCGSCWSFSACGSMEGVWAIGTGELISLSEQQLVDCATRSYGNHGCNGGLMDGAFQYAIDNGMCSNDEYSYNAEKDSCETCKTVATFDGCIDVTPNNQQHLKEAVAMNPVSVAIEADTRVFQMYSDGVITSDACGTSLDHGVLIVGYGEESDTEYWLVKNSWGETWGESGYVKIERSDATNDPGICGIAMQPSYPTM